MLQTAYSAERAASFAYISHAGSLKDPVERAAVQQIEQDEWDHRRQVLAITKRYEIDPQDRLPVENSNQYCKNYKSSSRQTP